MKDADLLDIKASLRGETEAYERLINRYEKQITRLMWRFSRDHATCEELVQDVFVQAYFSLKTYSGRGPFVHWLSRIGTRIGYRFWKEQARREQSVPLAKYDGTGALQIDSLDESEAAEILHRLLARLERADRLVLTLMYFEDYSTKEIAERIGATRGMVKMRAMRARRRLKKIAERENLLEKLK